MKTQYTEAEETRIENEVEGVRETSDSSVASRGNVKNTLKEFNKHLEEHYYDTSEINYFFDKIWHFIKKHVIHTEYFITVLGKIRGSHVDSTDYNKIKNKPISVKSVDNLVESINTKIEDVVKTTNSKIDSIEEEVANIDMDPPNGFVYTEYKEEKSARELWPKNFWLDITSKLYRAGSGKPEGINRIWKKSDLDMTVDNVYGLVEYNSNPKFAEEFIFTNRIQWLIDESRVYYNDQNQSHASVELSKANKNCGYVIFGSKSLLYVPTLGAGLYWEDTPSGLVSVPQPFDANGKYDSQVTLNGTENNIFLYNGILYWRTGNWKTTYPPANAFWLPKETQMEYAPIKHLINSFEIDKSKAIWLKENTLFSSTAVYIVDTISL